MDTDKFIYFVEKEVHVFDQKFSTYCNKDLKENTLIKISIDMNGQFHGRK
jgi:hypothetical protein